MSPLGTTENRPFETVWSEVHLPGGPSEWLYLPDGAAVRGAWESGALPSPPYWAQVWPSAKALASYIHGQAAALAPKRVVELGAGLGLPSLAAARYAASGLCTDADPNAVALAGQSAQRLGLKNLSARMLDWTTAFEAIRDFDLLLLSDVAYHPESHLPLLRLLEQFLELAGKEAWMATPERFSGHSFLSALAPFTLGESHTTLLQDDKPVQILVSRLGLWE